MSFTNRFKSTAGLIEWPGYYNPGGFHPVSFGDVLDGRYRICRKLGYGAFSTVWLAYDERDKMYIALKIGRADSPATLMNEVAILRTLSAAPSPASSAPIAPFSDAHVPIPSLLASFNHHGPNGTHPCLALPPLGRALSLIVQKTIAPGSEHALYNAAHWQPRLTRHIARQFVSAIAHLHAREILHRDIKLDNVLLCLPPSSLGQDLTISQGDDTPPIVPVERLDGCPLTPSAGDAPYLAVPTPLSDDVPLNPPPTDLSAVNVQLVDFGAACCFADAGDGNEAYAHALRAPELVLGNGNAPGVAADVWALGLSVYQLVTLRNLWPAASPGAATAEEADDELLLSMVSRLGKMPKVMKERWANWEEYVDTEGEELPELDDDGEPLGDEAEKQRKAEELLEGRMKRDKPEGMGKEETVAFTKWMRMCLAWLPEQRASANQLLEHAWMKTEWEDKSETSE